jgi:hypothetical protein
VLLEKGEALGIGAVGPPSIKYQVEAEQAAVDVPS